MTDSAVKQKYTATTTKIQQRVSRTNEKYVRRTKKTSSKPSTMQLRSEPPRPQVVKWHQISHHKSRSQVRDRYKHHSPVCNLNKLRVNKSLPVFKAQFGCIISLCYIDGFRFLLWILIGRIWNDNYFIAISRTAKMANNYIGFEYVFQILQFFNLLPNKYDGFSW